MTERELCQKMAVLMGGRAAEMIIFNELTTGATDDLAQATNIARTMVMRYGMVKPLGQVAYEGDHPSFLAQPQENLFAPRTYSESTSAQIDDAVRTLVEQAFNDATLILQANLDPLKETAERLLSVETLSAADLPAIPAFELKH